MKHSITKKFICIIFSVLFIFSTISSTALASTPSELEKEIARCVSLKNTAHEMAECARALGYPESHVIIKTAQNKWHELNKLQTEYQKQLTYQNDKLAKWRKEYPNATAIYEKLKAKGLSDVTTCAIIGNVMTETGGNTLSVNPYIYGYDSFTTYYGMCQWSLYYNPSVNGKSIDGQIEYLMNTIQKNMKSFGGNYEYFKSMTDVGAAAKYFNTYYERGSGNAIRANNARIALKYYTS